MKRAKKIFALLLALLVFATACSTAEKNESNKKDEEVVDKIMDEDEEYDNIANEPTHDFSDKLKGEDGVVRWVRGHSGNLMMTMAEHFGYLEEYGLEVEQIPMQTTDESFAAVSGDIVDIVSNAGTATPLQRIATGDDLQIFGGHMVEGAVWIVGGKDAEWEGIESLVGKTIVARPTAYQISGLLLEAGYDPLEDVNWVQGTADSDGMTMVKTGDADYASLGTEFSLQAKTDPGVTLCVSHADLMPKYSCCRMETASRFIDNKPNTTKALLKALLRGMRAFEKEPELASELLAEELDVPLDFVEAYTLDDGYEIHPDPLYNSCVRAWAYLDELGFLDENAKNIDLRDYIKVELYKEALDEVTEEVGEEDPEYWEEQVKYFEENNSMYYDKKEEKEYFENLKKTIEENKTKNAENLKKKENR